MSAAVNAVRSHRNYRSKAYQAELQVNATPETINQRQDCVFEEMLDRGKLHAEQLRAAREIAAIFNAITAPLRVRTVDFSPVIHGLAKSDDWAPSLSNAYVDHYGPWREWAARVQVRNIVSASLTMADLVIAMAVDNVGIRQMANWYQMDQRTVLRHIREGLYEYAKIAMWIEENGKACNAA